jgi:thymidine kinase
VDKRYDKDLVVTHSGVSLSKRTTGFSHILRVNSGTDLLERFEVFNSERDIDVVAVDEVFMINGAAEALKSIYKMGKTVLVSSLQLSSSGEPYKEMLTILPWATNIQICPAVCSICGEDAYFTKKIAGDNDPGKLEIGGSELYQPRCYNHFDQKEPL